jgi:hypothetical protein
LGFSDLLRMCHHLWTGVNTGDVFGQRYSICRQNRIRPNRDCQTMTAGIGG